MSPLYSVMSCSDCQEMRTCSVQAIIANPDKSVRMSAGSEMVLQAALCVTFFPVMHAKIKWHKCAGDCMHNSQCFKL